MKGPERKIRKTHGSRGNFPSTSAERKPSSFYKLILQPNIQSKKLESWKVALVKEDNKLLFHDGWEDFVECHSIGFAHFLQFIYEGNSRFEVHIFDKTACEICYRCSARNSPQDPKNPRDDHQSQQRFLQKKQHVDNDISVETSDVIKLEIEDEPALDKIDEQVHDDDDDDNDNDNDFTSGFSASDDERVNQYEGNQHNAEANDAEQRNLYEDHVWLKHEEALALVGFSKPHNPFFVVVVKERHLKRACLVYVPAHFAQANLWCRPGKFVELETSDGRRWSVRCNKACRGCNLGAGWIHFTRDNNLKAGDVCVFELIDAKTYIMKVHVLKKSQMQSELLD